MTNIVSRQLIDIDLDFNHKKEVIMHLASVLGKDGRLNDQEKFIQVVFAREDTLSTYIGNGIGIPHGKTDAVKEPSVAFIRTKNKIQWGDDENEIANMIFLIAVPEHAASNTHLKILATLSRRLMDENFRSELKSASNKEEVFEKLKFLNDSTQ